EITVPRGANAVHPAARRAARRRPGLPAGDQHHPGPGVVPDHQPAAAECRARPPGADPHQPGRAGGEPGRDRAGSRAARHAAEPPPRLRQPETREDRRRQAVQGRGRDQRSRVHSVTPQNPPRRPQAGRRDDRRRPSPGGRPPGTPRSRGGSPPLRTPRPPARSAPVTRERPADPRPPRPPRPARRLPPRGDANRRLGITLLAIIFVLSLFAGRLVQLQGMESGNYRKLASKERDYTIPLPALRGSITGANGQVLAMTVTTYTVTADPPLIP